MFSLTFLFLRKGPGKTEDMFSLLNQEICRGGQKSGTHTYYARSTPLSRQKRKEHQKKKVEKTGRKQGNFVYLGHKFLR